MEDLARETGASIPGTTDEEVTTVVDVHRHVDLKRRAFAEHRSQNNPDSPFLNMQSKIAEAMMGTETFVLARGMLGEEKPESDLFSGLSR